MKTLLVVLSMIANMVASPVEEQVVYEPDPYIEESPDEYFDEGEVPEEEFTEDVYVDEDASLEEMYKYNHQSYDRDSEVWYDVPAETCPGHDYLVTEGTVDGETYFRSYMCKYCGDYYEEEIKENENEEF